MIEVKNNIDIESLLKEYEIDDSIFSEMDDRLVNINPKWKELSIADKTLMVLYAEYQSYRDVGAILGISHTTIARFIKQIRNKLC